MDHDRMRLALSALRDGALEAPAKMALERHVESCSDCRAELRDWERAARAFLRRPQGPTSAETERCARAVMARLAAGATTVTWWDVLTSTPWLTPALGLASVALVLSFLPYGGLAALEPLFVAQGYELSLAPARRIPAHPAGPTRRSSSSPPGCSCRSVPGQTSPRGCRTASCNERRPVTGPERSGSPAAG